MSNERFLYVLDNDEDTIYDLFEKNILSKKDIEDKMNDLHEENGQLKQFQDTVFVLINKMIEIANHHRTPINLLNYGDDLGYWNGVYQKLNELREILEKEKGDEK